MTEKDDLHTDEPSEEANNHSLCGMASIDSTESNQEKKKHMSTWYVDIWCSRHMTGNKELLSNYEEKLGGGSVTFGDDRKGQ